MLSAVGSFYREASGYQKFLYFVGIGLSGSGLVHLGVYAVDGGSWAGPISWRKPIVFGFSFGLTSLTLGWVMTFLPRRRRLGWLLAGAFGLAAVVEVALITMQRWRGVPSHFNDRTAFDSAVFAAMGAMVGVVALVIVFLASWSLLARLFAPTALAWAIRIGLVLLVASQAIGVAIALNDGPTFGTAGTMKLAHAIALHGAQIIPAIAWVLLFTTLAERRRIRIVAAAAASYALILGVSLFQAVRGRAPFDLAPVTLAAVALSGAVLVGTAAAALALVLRAEPISSNPLASP